MSLAANMAKKYGRGRLAEKLNESVAYYKNTPPVKAKDVYSLIDDFVCDEPSTSYEKIIKGVATNFNMEKFQGGENIYYIFVGFTCFVGSK